LRIDVDAIRKETPASAKQSAKPDAKGVKRKAGRPPHKAA
jgi:hypothetical protein